jgi:DNA-binding response OmpR family regulator
MAVVLKIMGHEVGTAYDGEQAVAAAEAMRPEVAILDIGMPKLNGYEACRRIRAQRWGRAMYVIALTGWGQEEDRRRTEEAGFDGHMVKPADPAALIQLLPTLTARRAAAAEDESDTPGRSGS